MQVIAAPRAREGEFSLDPVELGYSVALLTQYLLSEAGTEEVIQASIVVGEKPKKLLHCKWF
jgi:hypothetical protein